MGLTISFWITAVVCVLAALGVVFMQNIFRAALMLILCFIAVAVIYITLSADFLAAVQILVYVGAISVLIILAVMMTREVPKGSPANLKMELPAAITTAALMGVLAFTVLNTPWNISAQAPLAPTTNALADRLFGANGFILPVEIGAALMLAAIIGAITITREK